MSEVKRVSVIMLGEKYHYLKFDGEYSARTICGLTPKPNKHGWKPRSEQINIAALTSRLVCERCQKFDWIRNRHRID